MKKHIIAMAAVAAFFVPSAQAQDTDIDEPELTVEKPKPATRKGNFTIGSGIGLANASYGSDIANNDKVYSYDLRLSPSVGYFVGDHWMLSAALYGGISADRNEYGRYRNISASLGVGARYYIGKAVNAKGDINKLRFFAEAGGMYSRNWYRAKPGSVWLGTSTYYDVALNAGVGANYFVSQNVAFEAGLSYNRNLEIERSARPTASLGLNLGMRFFLNRK